MTFLFCGGDEGNRTLDPLLAGQVLSQLSYTPVYSHILAYFTLCFTTSRRCEYSQLPQICLPNAKSAAYLLCKFFKTFCFHIFCCACFCLMGS